LPICDLALFFAIVDGDDAHFAPPVRADRTVLTVAAAATASAPDKGTPTIVTTILRRLLGVVLILAGLAGLIVGGWFARALGTDGTASFVTTPTAGIPLVIGPDTNARTDIPLTITATADPDVPVTVSIAPPSDAQSLLADSRHTRVTGVDVREWAVVTTTTGSGDPITPTTADLWRSQTTGDGAAEIVADLENAPETMIITTPDGSPLTELEMTWVNPAWFYQALSLAFGGLLVLLVGLAVLLRRSSDTTADATSTEVSR
jgi:hypothetical protein